MQQTPTVRLVQRTSKLRKDGAAPLWIRITANRKSRFVSTGIAVDPRHWNDRKGQVRATHPLAPTLNARLQELIVEAVTEAMATPSADIVKEMMRGSRGSLVAAFQSTIDDRDRAGRYWEWKKYKSTLRKLQACFGEEIGFADLDRKALHSFEKYLRVRLGNGPSTVLKELQRVHTVLKQAMRDGALKPEHNPFLVYERPKGSKPNRRKLSLGEVEALAAVPLTGGAEQPDRP